MATDHSDAGPVPAERVARLGVPAGLAVLTWLVVLLAVGTVASLGSLSFLNLLPLAVVVLLFWPLYLAAPWRPGLSGRVLSQVRTHQVELVVTAGLLVVRTLPFAPGPLVGLLNLPFRSAGLLFGAGLFYRQHVGAAFGRFLLSFGQWYLETFWVFVLASVLVGVARRVR